MDDSLSNGVIVGLDLNQEPTELLPSYQGLIDQLGSGRIHERLRQLGEVIERRSRDFHQQARSYQDLVYPAVQGSAENSSVALRITRNVGNESGESSRVDYEDVTERNNGIEKNKKISFQLVARALAMDPEIKKVGKDGGNFYDCNICLEMAEDPILTCCGHLFCWACFYKLPHQDSASKECPVCLGEVSDNTIVPIYGNGNNRGAVKTESLFEVPPRPKAQRIESGRQVRVNHGLPVPVSEALRRIRTSIGAIGGHIWEVPRPEIAQTTDGLQHLSHHQGLRVSPETPSLADISTALTDAEVIVDEIETYIGPSWRTSEVVDAAVHLENLTNMLQQQSSSSSRRRSRRLLDAESRTSNQPRRRRLN